MKNCYALFLLMTNYCIAQLPSLPAPIPTSFDKFITQPAIEWAAYAGDTARFTKNNLSEILRKRFGNAEIKGSFAIEAGTETANKIIFAPKKKIALSIFPSGNSSQIPVMDSLDNIVDYLTPEKITGENGIDSFTYNLVNLIQILYIEKGRLKSYIPWVAPKVSIHTSNGIFLGTTDYFSTAFNYKYNFNSSPADKIIALEQTKRKINADSIPTNNMLKELYGRNLVETLWPYILNNKLNVFSAETNKKLLSPEINSALLLKEMINVPVIDSTGNLSYTRQFAAITPADFKELEITQNWFYNQTRNIVFCTIPQIILFAGRINEKDPVPVIKIVF